MKYTTFNVQQLTKRKDKPWQARAKYKNVFGNWKDEIYKEYLQHQLATGEIERSRVYL